MNFRKYPFWIFLCAGILLSVSGCGKEEKVIQIGVSAPFTGDQASIGLSVLNGTKLAVAQANAEGDVIPGYKLAVSDIDDQHSPSQAVMAAKKFVSDRRVLGVVAHLNSSCTKPASAVYHEGRLAQITPASTNPEISRQGFDTFFRTCATDKQQGPTAAQFAVETLKAHRIFVIDDKTTYGKGLADEFQKTALALGVQIIGHEGITQGDKDFTPLLIKIKSDPPDLIFFGGIYPEGALLIKQARDLALNSQFIGGDGLMDPTLINLATPKASEGVYASMIGADVYSILKAKDFIKAYEAVYGPIAAYSAYGYDTANLLIEAIRLAGKVDREAVIQSIRHLTDFHGILGPVQFDQFGDNVHNWISIYVVKEGHWQFVQSVQLLPKPE